MIQKDFLFQVPNINANDAHIKKLKYDVSKNSILDFKKGLSKEEYLCICSGGTTSSCAKNDLITIDLRKNYSQISFNEKTEIVTIGGGVLMGNLLEYLDGFGRTFPIGLSALPGVGYILSGGVSPLTRIYGLAVDNIVSINGYLGTGDYFSLNTNNINKKGFKLLEGIKGAAPFFSIVTEIGLKTYKSYPILILEGFVNEEELSELITLSEEFPNNCSLQWLYSDKIYIYIVVELKAENLQKTIGKYIFDFKRYTLIKSKIYKSFNHIKFFPKTLNLFEFNKNNHSEVISLLGEDLKDNVYSFIKDLIKINSNKPNKSCYVASQQMGGKSKDDYGNSSFFIHRESTWKPWIYASWEKNNIKEKEIAMNWLRESWLVLKKYFPNIHLAQLHNHLNFHEEELNLAFGNKLNDLKLLKKIYDPSGILPPL